jgi:hypothetical protein
VAPGAVLSALWSDTAMTAFRWEGAADNRLSLEAKRAARSRMLLIMQLILSPFYLYSMAPFASTLFELNMFGTPIMNVNLGHLVIAGTGVTAAMAYPFMNHLARFTSWLAERKGPVGACMRLLSKVRKKEPNEE